MQEPKREYHEVIPTYVRNHWVGSLKFPTRLPILLYDIFWKLWLFGAILFWLQNFSDKKIFQKNHNRKPCEEFQTTRQVIPYICRIFVGMTPWYLLLGSCILVLLFLRHTVYCTTLETSPSTISWQIFHDKCKWLG